MRNPSFAAWPNDLIVAIFDRDDRDLRINVEERKELILAFVRNAAVIEASHQSDFFDGCDGHALRKRFATVWKLASKWPLESGIREMVYRFIGVNGEIKRKTYEQCQDPYIRYRILEGCYGWEDRDVIALGLNEVHPLFRSTAYRKIWDFSPAQLQNVLAGEDKEALSGLSENPYLSVEELERVKTRLEELGQYWQAKIADRTIRRIARQSRQSRRCLKV